MNKGEKVAFLAILVNLFLFAIKYFGAEISGSIALKAEAFHTMADLIASLSILGGAKNREKEEQTFSLWTVQSREFNVRNYFASCILYRL